MSLAHTHEAALVLVALKLLSGLDAADRPQALPGLVPEEGWMAWARRMLASLPLPSRFPEGPAGALAMDPADLEPYLEYCRAQIFAGSEPPELLAGLVVLLDKLAAELKGRAQGGAGPAAVVSAPPSPVRPQEGGIRGRSPRKRQGAAPGGSCRS